MSTISMLLGSFSKSGGSVYTGGVSVAPTPLPTTSGYIMAVGSNEIILSSDSGDNWTNLFNFSGGQKGGTSCADSFLIAGYGPGASRVYDSTGSNPVIGSGSGSGSGMRIYKSPVTNTVIVRPFGNTLHRSTNNGSTYTQVLTSGSYFSSGLHCGADGVWFFSCVDTNATPRVQYHWLSFDDGVTWNQSTIGLPPTSASGFAGFSGYMNGMHHAWIPNNASSATSLYTSADALNWTFRGNTSSIINNSFDVYVDKGIFYRDGYYYTATNALYIARSTNGYSFSNWGVATSGYNNNGVTVAYVNGKWFLSAASDNINYYAKISSTTDPTAGWSTVYTSSSLNSYSFNLFGLNQRNPIAPA